MKKPSRTVSGAVQKSSRDPVGIKHDQNKSRWDLIPWDAVRCAQGGTNLHEALSRYSDTGHVDALATVCRILIGAAGLRAIASVLTYGADKYSENNWQLVSRPKERYLSALWRHVDAGEGLDSETGLPSVAHAACNALFLLHFEIAEGE